MSLAAAGSAMKILSEADSTLREQVNVVDVDIDVVDMSKNKVLHLGLAQMPGALM